MNILSYILENISNLAPSDIILLFTALIILIYTCFTYMLWKESNIQTSILQSPYLKLRFDDRKFYLKNIGKSIATKIIIEGYRVLTTDIEKEFEIKFNPIDLLEPMEEKHAEYKIYENGTELSDNSARDFAVYFFPLTPSPTTYKDKKAIIRMTYKNILGRNYYFDVLVAEDEYRIKRFGKYGRFQKWQRDIFLKLQGIKVRTEVWIKRKL